MAKILVVDDEMGIRELLSEILEDEGHETLLAENAPKAIELQAKHRVDLILLDIWMPEMDGIALLKHWVASQVLRCPVVMMSGHATIDTAVEATGLGAIDFLEKPIAMGRLLASVHKALSRPVIPSIQHPVSSQLIDQNADSTANDHVADTSNLVHLSTAMPQLATATSQIPGHGSQTVLSGVDLSIDPWAEKLAQIDLNKPLREVKDALEVIYFTHLLAQEHGAMTRVSEISGLERTHLYRKLKTLNIEIVKVAK